MNSGRSLQADLSLASKGKEISGEHTPGSLFYSLVAQPTNRAHAHTLDVVLKYLPREHNGPSGDST